MEYIYAAMLLHRAGRPIEEAAMKKGLQAAGVQPDEAKIRAVLSALEGVDIEQAIKEAAIVAPAATAASGPAKAEHGEEKKKVEEENKSEEEAAAGLGALFG